MVGEFGGTFATRNGVEVVELTDGKGASYLTFCPWLKMDSTRTVSRRNSFFMEILEGKDYGAVFECYFFDFSALISLLSCLISACCCWTAFTKAATMGRSP